MSGRAVASALLSVVIGAAVFAGAAQAKVPRIAVDEVRHMVEWLSPLASAPEAQCDKRIVADVEFLAKEYGLRIMECFGRRGHVAGSAHRRGVAVDAVQARRGPSGGMEDLARRYGWAPECNAGGCFTKVKPPFRLIRLADHIHIEWRAPLRPVNGPAKWVEVLPSSVRRDVQPVDREPLGGHG